MSTLTGIFPTMTAAQISLTRRRSRIIREPWTGRRTRRRAVGPCPSSPRPRPRPGTRRSWAQATTGARAPAQTGPVPRPQTAETAPAHTGTRSCPRPRLLSPRSPHCVSVVTIYYCYPSKSLNLSHWFMKPGVSILSDQRNLDKCQDFIFFLYYIKSDRHRAENKTK